MTSDLLISYKVCMTKISDKTDVFFVKLFTPIYFGSIICADRVYTVVLLGAADILRGN